MAPALIDRDLIVVTGNGGAGKSTFFDAELGPEVLEPFATLLGPLRDDL